MKCRALKLAPALALAGAVGLLAPTAASAQTATLFFEDFGSVVLRTKVDELGVGTNPFIGVPVWTHFPPLGGWNVDSSGVPGMGVLEWDGWSFARKDFWIAAENQTRSQFTKGIGIIAVADSDEYDDIRGGIGEDYYDTFFTTPDISLIGVSPGTAVLTFDSSWRPEGFDDGISRDNNQTATIRASFDGGSTWTEILRWDSDPPGFFFHPAAQNETVTLSIFAPVGATRVRLEFGMTRARNDWWWAVDNLRITGAFVGAEPARTISGTISLEECDNVPVDAMFVLHPSDNSGDKTVLTSLSGTGAFTLTGLPAKNYQVKVKTGNTLSRVASANATSGNISGLTIAPLKGGDANNDNSVDVLDLDRLIQAFDTDATSLNWNPGADFDCSGGVDVLDLDVLIRNFDQTGEDF
jgi:hypothetical protein